MTARSRLRAPPTMSAPGVPVPGRAALAPAVAAPAAEVQALAAVAGQAPEAAALAASSLDAPRPAAGSPSGADCAKLNGTGAWVAVLCPTTAPYTCEPP